MKGALNSVDARLSEALLSELFPDITYGHNSGGDPKFIPDLTYQGLLDFHRRYYHPSRCLFFFYGNMPIDGHLQFIENHVLSKTEPVEEVPPLPLQPRFSSPVRIERPYPMAPDEDDAEKGVVGMGWLTCHVLEQLEVLALQVLDIALMGTDAAPLKMTLLKSGLCKQAGSYLDSDVSEVPFFLVLKGCEPEKIQDIEKLVFKTLQTIIDAGIPPGLIDAAIHQLELHRLEITGDYYPFGLILFMRSALLKQFGGEAENSLVIHSLFNKLRELCHNPKYLSGLAQKPQPPKLIVEV